MNSDNISIGTDIEEVNRFKNKTLKNDAKFLNHIYTSNELEYCFSKNLSYMHLCARFCAKEAIVKALSGIGINDVYYSDIEILNKTNGMPYAVIEKYPNIKIKISLSHCKTHASANALIIKE